MEMSEIGQNKFNSSQLDSGCPATEEKTVQKMAYKIRRLFGKVISSEKPVTRSSVIETDYDSGRDAVIPSAFEYGSYDDMSEYKVSQNISRQLADLLTGRGRKNDDSQLLVPSDLPGKISQDVLRMSQNEPCGIRGCVLYINLEEKSVCRKLGKIECDPSTVATFELYLTLKEDTRPWVMAKSMLVSFKGCLINGSSSSIKIVCPGFQLAKKKLYRPN